MFGLQRHLISTNFLWFNLSRKWAHCNDFECLKNGVCLLVDMNLSQRLRNRIMVERKGYAFFVGLDIANLLVLYTH